MKFDLKDWKVHKRSAKETTMVNPQGHKLTIQHGALSPKARGQLAEMPAMMAEGGEAIDPQDAAQGPTAEQVQAAQVHQPPQAPVTINIASPSAPGPMAPAAAPQPFSMGQMAPGLNPTAGLPDAPESNTFTPPPEEPAQPPAAQAPAPQAPTQQAPTGQPTLSGGQGQPSDPFGTNAQYGMLSKGINNQMAGIQGQAFAESQLAKNQAAVLQAQQAQQQAQMADFQAKSKSLETERQHFQDDIVKAHIDPNKYLGDMSTGKHVMTAIGLILGGIGGGITHQENPALKFLNSQIDRDINAQKANLETKQTLLSANMKQFGILRDATDMTRVMMADTAATQLKMEAAKSGDPAAKARALQAVGQLQTQYAPILGQIAMRQSLLSGVKNGTIEPSAYLRAVVPPEQIAGVAKEVAEAQNMASVRDNTLQAFDQIAQLNTVSGNVMHPLDNQRKINALRGAALDKLTKDTSGRVTPETVKLIEGLFPQAGSGAEVNQVQRAQLNKLLTQGMHFPLAEQWMGRDLLIKGTMTGAGGQSKFKEMPPVLPSK